MKVGIVGAGAVGSACLLSLVLRGSVREIVLVNRNRKRADGVVTDVQYGAVLSPEVELHAGDYGDLSGACLVMVTAGVNEKTGGATDRSDPAGRLRLLDANAKVYEGIVPQVQKAAPDAVMLVVTDPPDPLADVARLLGYKRVLSTGTFLDSLRFRVHLARRLGVNPRSVDAQVLGEHGTSSVFLWSSARVGGRRVLDLLADNDREREQKRKDIEQEVRYANITIIEGIGASQYGIGMVCARIAEIIQQDEQAVIPIGSYNPKYGVTLSLPSRVGQAGIAQIVEPEMSNVEEEGLQRSAEASKKSLAGVNLSERARKAA